MNQDEVDALLAVEEGARLRLTLDYDDTDDDVDLSALDSEVEITVSETEDIHPDHSGNYLYVEGYPTSNLSNDELSFDGVTTRVYGELLDPEVTVQVWVEERQDYVPIEVGYDEISVVEEAS